jgi:hypothetical protein
MSRTKKMVNKKPGDSQGAARLPMNVPKHPDDAAEVTNKS